MDYIQIKRLQIYAYHGVFAEEKKQGQNFYVSAKLYTDLRKAGRSDDLSRSTHYGEVCELLCKVMTEQSYDLIETVAEKCAHEILTTYPLITSVELTVSKPEAPIPLPFEDVSVTVKREWHTVYIAYGSNMGKSDILIDEALDKIRAHQDMKDLEESKRYITKPYGGVEQPDFLNGVVRVQTLMTPEELLEYLHELEAEAGRERVIHWGPRTLDLDIIFYDDLVMETVDLTIPHIDMNNREFVLRPLADLTLYYVHPVLKVSVCELLGKLMATKSME